MPNVPFQVGDGIQIGAAVITASGAAIVLPANTSVGGTQVATSTDVSTGGGPKITNLQITDNSWTVLDDTAVDTAGGYVLITGTNFVSGALVYFNQTPANSVAFVSATTLRVTVPALTAGTYIVYVINPDGGTAIRVPGLTASANPAWQTASALPEQYDGVAITLNLVATDATSYTLTSGSLPPGLSLNTSTGAITGTVTGVAVDTTYTFTVRATDAQLQDSPRTFTVTITVSDPYFKLTTLLLSGSAMSANTVIRDSSTNNFNLTVYGDARASNFTPYGSGWSNLFNSNRLNIATTGFAPGTGNFTVEAWIYPTSYNSASAVLTVTTTGGLWLGKLNSNWVLRAYSVADQLTTTTLPALSTWTHVAWVRNGSTATIYFNGNSVVSGTVTYNFVSGSLAIGDDGGGGSYFLGYISNLRYTTTAVYTANFTPATTNLTSITGTQLLTCQDNRFRDTSANAYTITTTGTPTVTSFNPFNITNTGVAGSMYFDGTGDYLSVVDNSAFTLANYNFCIELWIYPTASMANYANFLGQWANSTTNCAYTFRTSVSQNVQFAYTTSGNGQAGTTVDGSALVISSWNHIVVCRNGTTLSIFQNGVRTATHNISTNTISDSSRDQQIGFGTDGSAITGYMSNLRLVTGNSIYDPTLTTLAVPIQPLTAVANTQLLTLQYDQPHNNHTFLDSSSNQFLITRSGNATQGTFSPFSQTGWSVYFDGSYDCIKVASDAAFGLGTGNFTIELWVNFDDYYAPQSRLAGQYTSGNTNGWQIYKNANSYNLIFNTNTADHITYNWSSVATNTWYHIAIVRSGTGTNQTIMYINGVNVATGTCSHSVGANQVVVGGLDWAASYSTKGYISSFRYSNIARTIVVPTVPYSSDANTLVLTCQSNRFIELSVSRSITIAETPKIQAFSPFAPTAVYNPVTHGGSAYFDRTGDFLSLATNNSFDFGTGNFTVELFYYPLAYDDIQMFFSGTSNYQFGYSATDSRNLYYYGSSGGNVISGTPAASMLLNQWNHIVLVRSGTSLAIMSNGVRQGTATHSSSVNFSGSPIVGGYADNTAFYAIRGYIAGFRAVKGVAIYDPTQTTYTVPAAPVTATTNTSLLLNFTDAAIIDSTGRNVIETVADAKTSSVVTKFTGGSMYFDGTGDGLAWPISSTPFYQIVSTNWTIEMWMYKFSTAIKNIMRCGPANAGNINRGWSIGIDPSINTIYFSSSGADNTFTGATIAINTWVHLAFSYTVSDSTLRVFYNGTSAGTKVSPALVNPTIAGGDFLTVATPYSGTAHFDGYLSDIRFTQGYARYTANFTAPTAPARLK